MATVRVRVRKDLSSEYCIPTANAGYMPFDLNSVIFKSKQPPQWSDKPFNMVIENKGRVFIVGSIDFDFV